MGFLSFLKSLFSSPQDVENYSQSFELPPDCEPQIAASRTSEPRKASSGRLDIPELARRLMLPADGLERTPISYQTFSIAKRGGGWRRISRPSPELANVQRRLLRRVFARLPIHSAVHGFEPKRSIVTNALPHVGRKVVIRMDIRDFFASTSRKRLEAFFQRMGWKKAAAKLLGQFCTYQDGLPQGAATSPRLANAVNYMLDVRLEGVAGRFGAVYTRYADDLTFSLREDDRAAIGGILRMTKKVLDDYGYHLHQDRKLRLARRHERQLVTGLVVNDFPQLPRNVRRRLRAVAHHLATGRPATMTADQLAGWQALEQMVRTQRQVADAQS